MSIILGLPETCVQATRAIRSIKTSRSPQVIRSIKKHPWTFRTPVMSHKFRVCWGSTCVLWFLLWALQLWLQCHIRCNGSSGLGGERMCLFKRGEVEKWMRIECEGLSLYEVVWGLYCSFESLKTNMSPKKGPLQKERSVFQPLFFKGHISFWGSNS